MQVGKSTYTDQIDVFGTTVWLPAAPSIQAAEMLRKYLQEKLLGINSHDTALQILHSHGATLEYNPYNGSLQVRVRRRTLLKKWIDDHWGTEIWGVEEAANAWGVSVRRIRALLADNRIPGAIRTDDQNASWEIPAGTPKPERLKSGPKPKRPV